MNLFREGFSGEAFLLCAAVGALTAVLYDLMRMFRVIFSPGKGTRFVLDLAFCLAAVTVAFVVSLPVSFGRLRLFQLAGEGVGAAVYLLAVAPLTGYLAGKCRCGLVRLHSGVETLRKRLHKKRPPAAGRHRKKIGKTGKFP